MRKKNFLTPLRENCAKKINPKVLGFNFLYVGYKVARLYPRSLNLSRCPRNHVFYVSKSKSACVWFEADVHETTFFMCQNRHRLVSGSKPMCTKPRFLRVKVDIGLSLDQRRCARNHAFCVSKSTSACVWFEADVHETTCFIGQSRHRLVSGSKPMCTKPRVL